MQYLNKTFSVAVRSTGADQDDFAKRWEETFGPGKSPGKLPVKISPETEEALAEIARIGQEQAQNELTAMYNDEWGPDHE